MLVKRSPWQGRRVLVTGHTGFKGSWLCLWLNRLGADVTGFALPPATDPNLFDQAKVAELVRHVEGDVRDCSRLTAVITECRPEVVFHLAAQPLVRQSYAEPVETFAANVMGTVHLLEACRGIEGLAAVVCITTDKCYENREWCWPYRESDPMGGHDPYSASKGAAEIAIAYYRRSFFAEHEAGIASVRAGNVIGGGDWATDRLIPDVVRAVLEGREPEIRNPRAVRPWQHVLEALGGYLKIAERLLSGDREVATAFNFGPSEQDTKPVEMVVDRLLELWGRPGWTMPAGAQPHEANLLTLDCSKARAELGWRPRLRLEQALAMVVEWHRTVAEGGDARAISEKQLEEYCLIEQKMEQSAWV